uniref:Uncharacterized protein n=1 Tax=Chromera velia CCMP2878 TaxID=1169474 RepID=A0A0G4HZU1_9ALVE|eukprot:Cvel_34162.t1-p1 / transcript=Cvel_34162.t1 / gene=Cvel_34162 / organism=Chromera_velia_CCMP2878 / gene_product=hypothetical protein / transcript_product=hypothetical protein / location=Cvel_scaffold5769:1679-2476(-) / protein_length=95 / sequence_SO=supercontig / SO=protein_coding / is_pseudo=false
MKKLRRRYEIFKLEFPEIVWLDRDCCGEEAVKNLIGRDEAWKRVTAKDLRRYVRRLIPQPAELKRRLQVVYDVFKTKSYNGVLLFTDRMETIWEE